jgi:uncharacterized protein YbaP (TraB family)
MESMMRGAPIAAFVSLASFGPVARSESVDSGGPNFWVARRAEARVFILGFGEARDTSWFTPSIRRAFEESSHLWLETAGSDASDTRDASAKRAAAERMEQLAHETGRTLFDALEPSVRERTLAYMEELGIARDSIETLRPWRAYYSIIRAFYANRKMP